MASKKNAKQKAKKASEQKKTITKVPEPGKTVEAEVKEDKKAAKDEKEPKTSRKAGKKKKDKPNIFQRGVEFVKSTYKELKKVSWLSGEELAKSTGVVAGCVAVFTLVIWLMDTGLGAMAAKLLSL